MAKKFKLKKPFKKPVPKQQEQTPSPEQDTPTMKNGGKWIQKAINPKHKGYCSPMGKATCTPARKALARRFKKGGDLYKKESGGSVSKMKITPNLKAIKRFN